MGFRINTNIAAMNAHRNSTQNNIGLDKSLQALSSGLRINTAADDASGLAIANSLRAQSTGLGQAINNANDGIGVTQTADGALDEYQNIINTVRTKSIQAASDGQNSDSRQAIQRDITKLLEEADNIAKTTSFNGQALLDGTFTDKNFQIGAYANETVGLSIDSVRTASTGNLTTRVGADVTNAETAATLAINGNVVAQTTASATASGGADVLAAAINTAAGDTVKAVGENSLTTAVVGGGSLADGNLTINGIDIDAVAISANDATGSLSAAINAKTSQTNVTAQTNADGTLTLTGVDGANIHIGDPDTTANIGTITGMTVTAGGVETNYGSVTLSGASVSITNATAASGLDATTDNSYSLSDADVTTYAAAQRTIEITDMALKEVDAIRSNIGSTQNQLESTVRNISVTQVNVAAAESQIRDVDFAAESANFAKHNILAQSGSYAMSQANAVQQNVMRLLQ
ncbi:MAG: flagellin [Campylobacterota bacterium]|nr:flagellin [Campylobacterota bacterium]